MIRQSVTFKADPHEIFEMLMDSRKHSRFTGSEARISRKVGGRFAAYDGYIEGTNLNIVPDQRIVQSWRGYDWPRNHYSKATFSLKRVRTGTHLSFAQAGVPARHYRSISQGWREHYWTPMKRTLRRRLRKHGEGKDETRTRALFDLMAQAT